MMSSAVKTVEELRWIDEPAQTGFRPEIEDFEVVKRTSLLKKCQENIFVPLGLLATTTCLTMGLINLKKGDSMKQQVFMRGRVGFQAFTLLAMTVGAYLHQRNNADRKKV